MYNAVMRKRGILLFATAWVKREGIKLSERLRETSNTTYMWNLRKLSPEKQTAEWPCQGLGLGWGGEMMVEGFNFRL